MTKEIQGENYKERLLFEYLRAPTSLRQSCALLWPYAVEDELSHFRINFEHFEDVLQNILTILHADHSHVNLPADLFDSYMQIGAADRTVILKQNTSNNEYCRTYLELIMLFTLLSFGINDDLHYKDHLSNKDLHGQEAMFAACFNLYTEGLFSAIPDEKFRVDVSGLLKMTPELFSNALQCSNKNTLASCEEHIATLHRLANAMQEHANIFKVNEYTRLGNIYDYWSNKITQQQIPVETIYESLLEVLITVNPGKYYISHSNLGDVMPHQLLIDDLNPRGLIPFHQLTLQLCYNLHAVFAEDNIVLTNLVILPPLPDVLLASMLVDLKLLTPKNQNAYSQIYSADSEFVVEWRALTVLLIDKLADTIRKELNFTSKELGLNQIMFSLIYPASKKIATHLRGNFSTPFKFVLENAPY